MTPEPLPFRIKSIQDAQLFELRCRELKFVPGSKPAGFMKQAFTSLDPRCFAAYFDLELTFLIAWHEFHELTGPAPSQDFLDSPVMFVERLRRLRIYSNVNIRWRAFYDKLMGFFVLYHDSASYPSLQNAKSRLRKFRTIASTWTNFPLPFQRAAIKLFDTQDDADRTMHCECESLIETDKFYPDTFLTIFVAFVRSVDKKFRTAEVHNTGVHRKWVLSSQQLEYFTPSLPALVAHGGAPTAFMSAIRDNFVSADETCGT